MCFDSSRSDMFIGEISKQKQVLKRKKKSKNKMKIARVRKTQHGRNFKNDCFLKHSRAWVNFVENELLISKMSDLIVHAHYYWVY